MRQGSKGHDCFLFKLEISPALRSGFRYGVSPPVDQGFDPVDQLLTLWITLPPSGPTKRLSSAALAVSAVALVGCQKTSWFCSWTLWITTLILRIRLRPSGSAPI